LRLKKIYDFFIQQGILEDLRSRRKITEGLRTARRECRKLKSFEKKFFDKENLTNPYSDTRILCGDQDTQVRRILVGIDMEVGEILLADRLTEKGKKIDLILAHHPEGRALAGLKEVMNLQTDVLCDLGLDAKIAKDFMDKRIDEVTRRLHAANHSRAVDVARLLDVPFMCCHTPADNHVAGYLQKIMDTRKPKTLEDIIRILMKEPEYQQAMKDKVGPRILVGKPKDLAGKIFVDMTGGTEGSKDVFGRLSQLGVKTLIGMHLSEEHFNRIKSEHMNVIIAGHIASDNLGMNLLFDKLEKHGDFEFIECSGFRRVKRK